MFDIQPYCPGALAGCEFSPSVERRAAEFMALIRGRVAALDEWHCQELQRIFNPANRGGRPKKPPAPNPVWLNLKPISATIERESRYQFGQVDLTAAPPVLPPPAVEPKPARGKGRPRKEQAAPVAA